MPVHVYELHYPGATPHGLSREDTRQVLSLSHVLENHLADAAVGLWLFEQALATLLTPASGRRADDQRMRAHGALMNAPQVQAAQEALRRQMLAGNLTSAEWAKGMADISENARLQVLREQWAAGQLPDSYRERLPHIHAHTVVYALDGIGKAFKALTEISGLPAGVTAAYQSHAAALPDLTAVRNSAHHVEDRARRRGPRGQTMTLQPVTSPAVNAPTGGVLIMGTLINGNRLTYTAADGTCRDIEISTATVTTAQTAIQQALNAITWRGHGLTLPL